MRGLARLISSAIRSWQKIGALEKLERPAAVGAGLEHLGAQDVGGHQVGRELDPSTVEAEDGGERVHETRLSKPRQPDQEPVAAAENGGENEVDNLLLADEPLGDRVLRLGELADKPLNLGHKVLAVVHGTAPLSILLQIVSGQDPAMRKWEIRDYGPEEDAKRRKYRHERAGRLERRFAAGASLEPALLR